MMCLSSGEVEVKEAEVVAVEREGDAARYNMMMITMIMMITTMMMTTM